MANTKISALTAATTPLAGTEVLPIVQSSATVKVAVSDLTAGRSISVSGLTNTGLTASKPVFTDASKVLTSTGVVPVANGGTNASTASITSFNNITGYTATGATGTTSTNLVFSTSPSVTTPTLVGDATLSTGNVVISTAAKGLTTGSAVSLGFGTNGSTSQMTLNNGFLGLGCTPAVIGGDLDIIANQNGVGIGYSTSVYRRITVVSSNSTSFISGSNTATLSAAGAWTNASDARLKKNITEIKYGLNTVMAIQSRSYNRNDVEGDFIGFIAQELKQQVPEVVFGSDTEQYTVDYGSLVAIAFKAIQELKAEIETLKGNR